MAAYQLANLDAKLVYLALQYHLARPGSELDHETMQTRVHGLAEVAEALEPQLDRAVATIELTEFQRERLLTAIAGTINELKTVPMLEGHASVPALDEVLRRLFPQIAEDPNEATQLAAHLLPLRRRLAEAAAAPERAAAAKSERPWWRFWERD